MTSSGNRARGVVGGGSAGWMAAAALATDPDQAAIVGVAQAGVPHMKSFNSEVPGINAFDFVGRRPAKQWHALRNVSSRPP